MFGVPESGSLPYPYFLLRNIFLLQSCHMTCEFVFVPFAEQHPVMVDLTRNNSKNDVIYKGSPHGASRS